LKYTLLELLFSNRWQWVRRRSKALWVKFPRGEREKWKHKELLDAHVFWGVELEDWR
jgi:hypothetical protein